MTDPKPLREELRSAVNMRQAALRNGRSRRKDMDRLRAAVGRAEMFLSSYPVADDMAVRRWCAWKRWDVELIIPGTMVHLRNKLLGDGCRAYPFG